MASECVDIGGARVADHLPVALVLQNDHGDAVAV
jgi:hypothetical protein